MVLRSSVVIPKFMFSYLQSDWHTAAHSYSCLSSCPQLCPLPFCNPLTACGRMRQIPTAQQLQFTIHVQTHHRWQGKISHWTMNCSSWATGTHTRFLCHRRENPWPEGQVNNNWGTSFLNHSCCLSVMNDQKSSWFNITNHDSEEHNDHLA